MKRGVLVGVLTIVVILLSSFASGYYMKSSSLKTSAKLNYNLDPYLIQNNYYKYPQIQFQIDQYQCTDSDGGINPYLFGAVWRIARNPSQYCKDWVAQYDQMCPPDPSLCDFDPAACTAILSYCMSVSLPSECFGTTGVDQCVGSSMVKEYYCSGSDIRYRYMSCARGCAGGQCR